jgi:hypothetical protein
MEKMNTQNTLDQWDAMVLAEHGIPIASGMASVVHRA